MSKYVSIGKRVLAMVLVLVMVLSYIPAGAIALAAEEIEALSATITREGDAAPYTYTLTVTKTVGGAEENVVPGSVMWAAGEQDEVTASVNIGETFQSSEEIVTAQFSYGWLSGVVVYKSETENSIAYAAAEDATWANKTVYVGVPMTLPVTTETGEITGAKLETSANTDNVDVVDDKYIPNKVSAEPIHLLTQQLLGSSTAVMTTKKYSAKVEYPELDSVTFKAGDVVLNGSQWFNAAQTITVSVVDSEVADAAYLPAVMVGDTAQTVTWTGEGTQTNPWTCSVTVDATASVSLLNQSVSVNIDGTAPVISKEIGYVDSEGNTYISFAYNSDVSGTKYVYIDGQQMGGVNTGRHSITLSGAKDEVDVQIHDRAGNISSTTISVQPQLKAELAASEAVNTVGNTHYYNADKQLALAIDIAGATDGGKYDVVNVAGTANDGAVVLTFVKGADGKYTCTYSGADVSLSGVKVIVTDDMGRIATAELADTYVYDTTAPTLELTVTAVDKSAGMLVNGDKIYLGVTEPNGVDKVTFKIDGTVVDVNYQDGAFHVEKDCLADAVTAVLVEDTVVDLAGNKLVSVTVKAGENSHIINCDANGKFSKELLADLQKPYSDEATLKITIVDGQLNADFAGKLYNEDNLTFKAQIVDGEGAGIAKVEYSVVGVENSTKTAQLKDGYYEFIIKEFLTDKEETVTLQVSATDELNNQNSASATFTVDTKAPTAVVTMPTEAKNSVDGVDYYNTVQTVVITVTDANFDADATAVSYKLNGADKTDISWDGNVGTITVADGEVFSDLAYIIKDKAGHQVDGSETDKFCVDATLPLIEIEMPTTPNQIVDGVAYYNAVQTVTVEVTDVNFDKTNSVVNYKINGVEKQGDWVGNVCTITIADGEVFSDLAVVAKDYATNPAQKAEAAVICVDTTDPSVKVTKSVEEGKSWQSADGNVDYYNGKVTYKVEISDTNLQESKLSYKLQGDQEMTTLDVVGSFELVLEDGQVLTDLSVYAKDKANNEAKSVAVVDAENKTVFNGMVYDANDVCVDMTDPAVKVTKSVEENKGYKFTKANTDYYNGKVTYKIEISDTNLQESKLSYKLQGDLEMTTVDVVGAFDLVLEDGQMLTDLSIYAKDKANNEAKSVEVVDAEGKTVFDGMRYKGDVIVDATAPTAALDVKGALINDVFVLNGVIFVKLTKPTDGDSGAEVDTIDEKIVLTVDVTDKNLSLDANSGFCVYSSENNLITGSGKVNEEASVTYTKELTVSKESYGFMLFDLTALDLAGNALAEISSVTINGEANDDLRNAISVKDGAFNGTIALDRHRPGSNDNAVPEIEITTEATHTTSNNELDLFNGAFSYNTTIKDANAGLQSVVWVIADNKDVVEGTEGKVLSFANIHEADIEIPVKLETDYGESNEVKLTIVATDNAGNIITYTEEFAVDTKAPVVEVAKSGSYARTVTEGEKSVDLFNSEVTYTVTVEDINLTDCVLSYAVEGKGETVVSVKQAQWTKVDSDKYSYAFTLADGDVLTALKVEALDNANNVTENVVSGETFTGTLYTGNYVAVDMTAPTVTVTKSVESEARYIQTVDVDLAEETAYNVDFYNGEVTYTINVADQFLTAENGAVAVVHYKLEGDTDWRSCNLFSGAQSDNSILSNNVDVFETVFTLTNGQTLVAFEIELKDNADHEVTEIAVTDADNKTAFSYNTALKANVYSGNYVRIDTTAPVVTVEKTVAKDKSFVQTVNGADIYNGHVSYTVTVSDANLTSVANKKQIADLLYKVWNSETGKVEERRAASLPAQEGSWSRITNSDYADSYMYTIVVEDGYTLTDIVVHAVDNAENAAVEVGVADVDNLTAFDADIDEKGKFIYIGNDVIADTAKPQVDIDVEGTVLGEIYVANDIIYLKPDPATNTASGVQSDLNDMKIKLTVKVTDKNISLVEHKENLFVRDLSADAIAWVGEPQTNATSEVVYEIEMDAVAADKTGVLMLNLGILDLAGNDLEITNAAINGNDVDALKEQLQLQYQQGITGVLSNTFALDRRRPTSKDDTDLPVIQVFHKDITPTTSGNNLELFNGKFGFALYVTDGKTADGEAVNNNSGLASVQWAITDAKGAVECYEKAIELETYTVEENYEIKVTPINNKESNEVVLKVIAIDNAGNIITYEKVFAVDTLAPRVTVSYDNNSAMNDKYFKADRQVTITVEDINFNAQTTEITTEVADTGWSQVGDVYTTKRTYNVDGIYKLDMTCVDKASNASQIDFSNGGANVAPQDFVLDKTAPVIEVTYNPASAVGSDGNGVRYFDSNRKITVTITEVNFDPNNQTTKLVANLGSRNALSAWTTTGDVHTATETFTEGNNYQVKIDYTDLAGNPAVSYSSETFSVDLGKPTIKITSGEMTTSNLNLVQNDLVLGFTVNDAQNNLKNFDVELLFLDKDFKQTVVEGTAYYTVAGKNNRTTGTVTFANIAKEKINDGIYTVRITAEDYAGHKVELDPELIFSLNRFGSTFYAEDEQTVKFLTPAADGNVYQNKASTLKIIERNPNRVYQSADSKEEGAMITISVNGNSVQLEKGVDYLLEINEKGAGASKWYEYTYEILASNFFDGDAQVGGKYEILFFSVDAAGNSNTNESNEGSSIQVDADGNNTGKLVFTLDDQTPVVSILDMKSNERFDVSSKRFPISISDNTPCTIQVYIDGELLELSESMDGLSDDVNWLAPNPDGGYMLNLAAADARRDVRVVIIDAAGNEVEQIHTKLLVTQNRWLLYIYNPALVGATVAGLAAITFLVILLAKRRKKKEEQSA